MHRSGFADAFRSRAGLRRYLKRSMRSLAWRLGNLWDGLEADWQLHRCAFVLSTGRSGTDTLHRLWGLSDAIDAHHEPWPTLTRERQQALHDLHRCQDHYWNIFAAARGHAISRARRAGRVYAESSARMTFLAPALLERMPNTAFVFLHRHPSLVVRSGMRRGWYRNHPDDATRIRPAPGSEAGSRWATMSRFERICWYWDAYNRFVLDWLDGLPPSAQQRIFMVASADLFSADARALQQVFAAAGVPVPQREQVLACLAMRYNAQKQGAFATTDTWSEEHRAVLWRICGDTAQRLGYELRDGRLAEHGEG